MCKRENEGLQNQINTKCKIKLNIRFSKYAKMGICKTSLKPSLIYEKVFNKLSYDRHIDIVQVQLQPKFWGGSNLYTN